VPTTTGSTNTPAVRSHAAALGSSAHSLDSVANAAPSANDGGGDVQQQAGGASAGESVTLCGEDGVRPDGGVGVATAPSDHSTLVSVVGRCVYSARRRACARTHTRTHTHTTHTHTHTHTHTQHTHTHKHALVHTNSWAHARTHTNTHTHSHTCMYTQTRTQAPTGGRNGGQAPDAAPVQAVEGAPQCTLPTCMCVYV